MKRLILLGCLIYACSFFVYADDECALTLQEAKSNYNAGNYQKAKGLYNYIVSECGESYGNAAAMLRQCEEMLTPKLSVSRSNISVGASSGSTVLSVTSNRHWELRNTDSNMFSVYKNGNEITINYYANPSSSSRSDYFDVVTVDGSKSVRITISQSAASIASTLSVSPTSISCSASATTKYITVNCNTNWEIQYPTGTSTMYRATPRSGNMVEVEIYANSATNSRMDYFYIKTVDGSKTQKISLNQSGNTSNSRNNNSTNVNNSSNARNSNSAPYLTLSQTSINAGAAGTTQTIGVASNQSWKIDYPTGNMYSVTRNGNNIIVKINPNNTSVIRNDFFQVSTLDGSTNVKVYLYQAAATSSSSRKSYSASRSNSSYGQNTVYQSPYRRYIHENGVFEITWFGIRAGVGTAGALSYSLFKMRWGPIQFSPLEGTATYNFLSSHSNMDMDVSYQPTIDAFIPLGNNNALYAGIGPSYNFVSSDIWFKAEAGWHLHYGYCTSSDFFFRYDGTFCVGVSIQWSTGW